MPDLLRSTSFLSKLERLYLPRSSTQVRKDPFSQDKWPPNLGALHVSGGIPSKGLLYFESLPSTVTHLSIGNCPHIGINAIFPVLKHLDSSLRRLEILAPMPAVKRENRLLGDIWRYGHNLSHLKISLDLISIAFLNRVESQHASLQRLDLPCFDLAQCNIKIANVLYGNLGINQLAKIRIVGIDEKFAKTTWMDRPGWQHLEDIDDLLKAFAREDGEGADISEAEAGVVMLKRPEHYP